MQNSFRVQPEIIMAGGRESEITYKRNCRWNICEISKGILLNVGSKNMVGWMLVLSDVRVSEKSKMATCYRNKLYLSLYRLHDSNEIPMAMLSRSSYMTELVRVLRRVLHFLSSVFLTSSHVSLARFFTVGARRHFRQSWLSLAHFLFT